MNDSNQNYDCNCVISKEEDPLEYGNGRGITIKVKLPLKPQDLEDDFKIELQSEGRKNWVKDKNVIDYEELYEDFENMEIGLGCRKKLPKIIISPNFSNEKISWNLGKIPVTEEISQISTNRAEKMNFQSHLTGNGFSQEPGYPEKEARRRYSDKGHISNGKCTIATNTTLSQSEWRKLSIITDSLVRASA